MIWSKNIKEIREEDPIKLDDLKQLIYGLQTMPNFTRRYNTALFAIMYVDCFRQNEPINL